MPGVYPPENIAYIEMPDLAVWAMYLILRKQPKMEEVDLERCGEMNRRTNGNSQVKKENFEKTKKSMAEGVCTVGAQEAEEG